MNPVRALLAEDEPLLRAQLRHRLAVAWPELEICAEAENGEQALALFAATRPEIAFLDIQMPLMTGIEVARHLSGECHVVFVTAYDEFAVQAFEHGAVDYLLKPVTADRVALAVERLKARLVAPPSPLDSVLQELTQRFGGTTNRLNWIKASAGNTLRLIHVDDVLYFQSEDKYTKVVTRDGDAYIKKTIKELADELDTDRFWQIHRGTIIAVAAVASVGRDQRDQPAVRIAGRPETLSVSRSFAHLFKQM
jgi:DNA-binding LytR/AlgR family response regulator